MIEKLLTVSIGKKEQPFHWHKTMELDLVLEGEADVLVNNYADHVKKGELIVINREDPHCIENATPDFLYVQFLFNMETYNQYMPDVWLQYFKCTPEERDVVSINLKEEIKYYMAGIINLMENGRKTTDVEKTMISYSIEIIGCLALGFQYIKKAGSKKNEEYYSRLWKIIDYMYDNSNRKLSISEVAGYAYLSEAYITKLLNESTGKSFEKLLGHIRVEDSIKYLLNSDMSVTNIAYEVGFSAPRYFTATFINLFGCSPKEWREKYKNFFKMDSPRESDYMIYEEGIDKKEVLDLLHKYNSGINIKSCEYTKIDLRIDISDSIEQKNTINRNFFVSCDAKDVIDYIGILKLKMCQNELGINKIDIISKNTQLQELAEKNVLRMGLKQVTEAERELFKDVALEYLYSSIGIKKYGFYYHKMITEITSQYRYINKNVVTYGNSDSFHVILFSNENICNDYLMELSGLERDSMYILEKYHIKAMEDKVFEQINKAYSNIEANRSFIDKALAPQREVEIIMDKRTAMYGITLKPNELYHFHLVKLTKEI